jgi:hypothetical protein
VVAGFVPSISLDRLSKVFLLSCLVFVLLCSLALGKGPNTLATDLPKPSTVELLRVAGGMWPVALTQGPSSPAVEHVERPCCLWD